MTIRLDDKPLYQQMPTPRRQRSKFSAPLPKPWSAMSAKERQAHARTKSEAVVESVPADVLDALKRFAAEAPEPAVRAGRFDVVLWLERHHRRIEGPPIRGTTA